MFSGTGGAGGVRLFHKICSKLNKTVVFSRCINVCCSEEIMGSALGTFRKKIEKSDVLVVLSCASGVKAANITELSVPVVSVLNPVGNVVVASGNSDSKLLDSVCTFCGKCVLSFTSGICPVHECPAKSVYHPCKKAPPESGPCIARPEQECVWVEINKSGDPEALKVLSSIHKRKELTAIAPVKIMHTKPVVRWPVSIFLTTAQFFEKCVRWIQ